jgi:monofunctional biosynthetic peptidoglycan transglycosylase
LQFNISSRLKKLLLISIGVIFGYGVYIGISLMFLPSVADLASRRYSMTIQVKDWKGKYRPFTVGPKNPYWTPSLAIPQELKWAVIVAEDANFYSHEGIDLKAIKNALKYDLEKKRLARGASTITQQVAKNLFLTREKSISRKVKEVILAKRMEQELTKGRIIELYLNVAELGPMVYGIGHGANYYFGKPASALTPRECAFLAAMLPGPRLAYNPYHNLNRVLKRSDMILRLLRGRGVLSEAEYQAALAEVPNVNGLQKKVDDSIKQAEVMAVMSSASTPVTVPGTIPDDAARSAAPATPGDSPAVNDKPDRKLSPEETAPPPAVPTK